MDVALHLCQASPQEAEARGVQGQLGFPSCVVYVVGNLYNNSLGFNLVLLAMSLLFP